LILLGLALCLHCAICIVKKVFAYHTSFSLPFSLVGRTLGCWRTLSFSAVTLLVGSYDL